MTINAIRRGCESLHYELARAYHEAGAGLSESLGISAIFERHAELAQRERFDEVSAALAVADDPLEQRRLRYLREHVAWLYDAFGSRELTDAIHLAEGQAACDIDGQSFTWRELGIRCQNEPDRARRATLAAARDRLTAGLVPHHRQQVDWWSKVATELGFASHTARCGELGGLPLETLATVAQTLLVKSEGVYQAALRPALASLGVAPEEAAGHDLSFLFRATDYDAWFGAAELVPRIRRMCEAMWLEPEADGRVTFDLEDRPLKSPRPFCSVLRVPEQIVLVLRPAGGLNDYAAFLHELGHAMHFSHTAAELPWEFRYLGDNSVTEAFAFVFDRLVVDQRWLQEIIGLDDPRPLARRLALRELMMVRKYAAQLCYEQELFAAPDRAGLPERYRAHLEPAVGAQLDPAPWLFSIDPLYYCARYLQGWLFEAALHEHLEACYGPRWFAAPEAGRFLNGLYERGQTDSIAELFEQLDYRPLDPDPLLRRALRELG